MFLVLMFSNICFADDLKNLDPNNPGLWPKPIQIVLFILLFIALLFAGGKFDITKKHYPNGNVQKNNKLGDFALQEVKFEFSLQKTFVEPFHHSFVKYEIFRQDIF